MNCKDKNIAANSSVSKNNSSVSVRTIHLINLYRITNLCECFEYTNKQFNKEFEYSHIRKDSLFDTGIARL